MPQPCASKQKKTSFNILAIIILSCLGFLIYSNTLHSSFHFDDNPSIVENFNLRDIKDIKAIWDFWPPRFIGLFSFAFNYHLHGLNVFGYHLFNIIIHIISAILVFLFIKLTLSMPTIKDKKIASDPNIFAIFTALIFLAHPLQTQAVTYIVQRFTSLATLFYLASLVLYIKSRLLEKETPSSGLWRAYYSLSLITVVIAMFTKEIAITLPLVILLYEFYFLRREKESINWKRLIPFLVTILIVPLVMLSAKLVNVYEMRVSTEEITLISPMQYLLTQFRVIITYLRLLFLPLNQNVDYAYPISTTLLNLPTLASLLLLAIILISAIRLFNKHRLISFSIFWFFLVLLPESSVIPIKDVIFEHRLYLPMVGYSLFFVSLVYYLFKEKRARLILIMLTLLIASYSILTYERNKVWENDFTLWDDTACKSPNKARVYNNRGNAYQNKGNLRQALLDYNKAIRIDPEYIEAYNNRGNIYQNKGEVTQAISDYNKVIEIDPHYAEAYNNRGSAFLNKGDATKALLDFNKAIEIDPRYANAYNNRGNAHQNKGDLNQATSDYNKAIEINPGHARAYNNRGNVFQNKGEFDQAISDYNKAIEINPELVSAYNNRGSAYQNKGNLRQAILDYNKAIEIDPGYTNAYYNRGLAYQNKGEVNQAISDFNKAETLGYKFNPGRGE
ncbi:tetratricopeptide repeat protein [Candidatus Omnitrophota bacterium]